MGTQGNTTAPTGCDQTGKRKPPLTVGDVIRAHRTACDGERDATPVQRVEETGPELVNPNIQTIQPL